MMGLLFAITSWLGSQTGGLQKFGRPRFLNGFFGKMQMISASAMGLSHGMNDAQKTMGIIALALVGATSAGTMDGLPDWLSFLRIQEDASHEFSIALWIKVLCAVTMAAGTAMGGWRIIRTLGHKLVKLHPVNGRFAFRHSGIDHAQYLRGDHGRRCGQALFGYPLDRG